MAASALRELDRIDRRILDVLQHDGRISMTELAERIGLSATPCTERVRRLQRDGEGARSFDGGIQEPCILARSVYRRGTG